MKISKFLKEYKIDVFAVSVMSLIFTLACILTWGRLGNLLVDCGREAYVPTLVFKGEVLSRDIFNLYNPLSLQINAILYKIFGENLNVLYLTGIVSSYSILIFSYLCSRILFKPLSAFAVTCVIMAFGVFHPSLFNYIFPYAYAMTYALNFCIISVTLAAFAIKFKNQKTFKTLMYLSLLSIGLSVANKFEFTLIVIPIAAACAMSKKFAIKDYLIGIFLFLAPITISYGALFLQGMSLSDLIEYINFGKRFFESKALLYSYQHSFLLSPLKMLILDIFYFINFGLIFFIGYKLCKFSFKKADGIKKLFKVVGILLSVVIIGLMGILCNISSIFCWAIHVFLLFMLIFIAKKRFEVFNDSNTRVSIFFLTCAILSSTRVNFFINTNHYGTFLMPFVIIGFLITLLILCPEIFKGRNFHPSEKATALVFIIFSLTILISRVGILRAQYNYKIPTNKGTIYFKTVPASVFSDALNYINENVPQDATVLVLPEGSLLNFLSARKSVDKYYNLIPNHIEALGEDKIAHDLRQNPPDYIFIAKKKYIEYGKGYFCEDYALKICTFIKDDYSVVKRLYHDDFVIYKLKNYSSATPINASSSFAAISSKI